MAIHIVPRPDEIAGCPTTWAEQEQNNVIRSQMSDGTVKVRKRYTKTYKIASVSITLKADQYEKFMRWYHDTGCGVYPTLIKNAQQQDQAWRFISSPKIDYKDPNAFTATFDLERFESWP